MKDAYYFPHDANARNDERVLQIRTKYGWEGYGLYFAIVEIMRESTNYKIIASLIGGLSLALSYPKDKLLPFIDDCVSLKLFERNENFLWSESLMRRMKIKDDIQKSLIRAGKKGARKRWGSYSPPNAPPNGNKRKLNKKKLNEIKSNKTKYMDFVYLTEKEYLKLKERFGEAGLKDRIKRLNNYIGSKGRKYKSHYYTILNWEEKGGKNEPDNETLRRRERLDSVGRKV